MQACLDFGGSAVKVAVADAGRLHATGEFPNGAGEEDLRRAAELVRELAAGASLDAVAIAVPGLVDAEGRRLLEAHGKYAWLLDADLADWASTELGGAVRVENDARAALLGEVATGCATGERDAVILVLGTGIGTAAMVGGDVLRGPHGSAGILGGHVTIDRAGPVCNCGNIGCAEVFGGSWALADRVAAHRARGIRGDVDPAGGFATVTAAAAAGDPLGRAVLDEAILAWSACAVTLCHSFDPAAVILAGGVARSAGLVVGPLERYLDEHLWASVPRPRVLVSTDPGRSVLRGLAALAAEMEP